MRILIFLKPTNVQGTKKEYSIFRNFLIKDGYKMYMPEVYMRVCTNRKGAEKLESGGLNRSPEDKTKPEKKRDSEDKSESGGKDEIRGIKSESGG